MKNKYFLLSLVFFMLSFINNCYSQTGKGKGKAGGINGSRQMHKPVCIEIDAQNCCDGKNYVPKCIKENSTLGIKVFNVNPFKTYLGVTGKTSAIDFGNDSLFSFKFSKVPEDQTKKPGTTTPLGVSKAKFNNKGKIKKVQPAECCKDIDSIKKEIDRLKEVKKIKESESNIQRCSKKIANALYQLKLLNNAEKQLRVLFDTAIITKDAFAGRMWGILQCLDISKSCYCENKKDSCCNCAAHKKYEDLYDSLNTGYECLKTEYKLLGGDKSKAINFALSGKLLDKDKGVAVDVKDAKGSFEIKEENEMKPFFDNITSIIKKALGDSVKNALLVSAEYIDECIGKLCSYKEKEFYQQNYVKGPIEGDYITVTPFLKKPNGDTLHLKDFPVSKIKIYGGFRANVSTGISFSFLGMNDDDYTIARVNTDSVIIKKTKKGTNLYIPSLTTFIHFYERSCKNYQNAATLGISVNPTSLESLKVMAGYSLIFGDERRAVFSIGVIGGAVNRLKTKYESDKALASKDYPGLQETDITAKRFRVGMFIGLSYNLSKQR